MQWFGKAVGGVIGFVVGGPIGSMIGAALGHQFDTGIGSARFGAVSRRTQAVFFRTTFEVMGHLAKSDGRVSEEEIQIARRIMHGMKLSPEAVQAAIGHFTHGKSRAYPLRPRIAELREQLGAQRDLLRAFVEIQVQAAVGAGAINDAKRRLLLELGTALGIDRAELAQFEAQARGRLSVRRESGMTVEAAHKVLGVGLQVSDKQVKTAYRRLMNRHHPDKLVSRGLPDSMIAVAEQKTHEIRAAYERIKSHRAFK